MAIQATVLFDTPQAEIASLIVDRIGQSSATSIVAGFVTPSGIDAILAPIIAQPNCVDNIIVGAATYPGFEALDALLALGVPATSLYVHLGHTRMSGGHKNPFARYHPMLHSKVYYMELPRGDACAFIGSHNITSFALQGQNGEAAVLLEGPVHSAEFNQVRQHIAIARTQSIVYKPEMKEAFAWWTREYIEGLKAEVAIPQDITVKRTIIIFATASSGKLPINGDHIYFEIPSGIEQIESLKTETHLFIFDKLPGSVEEAIDHIATAKACFNCLTLGAENKQGNREVTADWKLDNSLQPVLMPVANKVVRPRTVKGMQQVRAEVKSNRVGPFEYFFDHPRVSWEPVLSQDEQILPMSVGTNLTAARDLPRLPSADLGWSLVKGLKPRSDAPMEKDQAVLRLVAPESGSFILVSLRRRPKRAPSDEGESP